jgi:hypothetical protein
MALTRYIAASARDIIQHVLDLPAGLVLDPAVDQVYGGRIGEIGLT